MKAKKAPKVSKHMMVPGMPMMSDSKMEKMPMKGKKMPMKGYGKKK